MSKPIVTRFAPSPTGFMHIGGVRTALFAHLAARQSGGTFILRIEDTDKAREVEGSIEHIQKSLQWLDIDWDYGPDTPGPFGSCIQSERLDIYKKYAQQLIDADLAYADPYTSEEVAAFKAAAEAEKRPFLFREHRPEVFGTWDGTTPLRFKVPEIKRYEWKDAVRGDLSAGPEMLDDFVLIKSDGFPTYNFAHIVDDNEMGVTHVMRGDEFISSTPKFLSLYDALKIPYPVFVSLPPIMAADGKKKLGKRDGAKDLLEYRADGYLPPAMRNFLALIGWNPGTNEELFPGETLQEAFSITKIQKSGGAFNPDKLLWMNKKYLDLISSEEQLAYFVSAIPDSLRELPQYSEERLARLQPAVFDRIHIKEEITEAATSGEYNWAFTSPDVSPQMLQWKNDNTPTEAVPRLRQVLTILETTDFSSPESLKDAIWPYTDEVGRGEVLWPLRVALTGRERSPDPFQCLHVLGKEESLVRITAACDKIGE